MFRFIGRTFDHKDRLRDLGARWNADARVWEKRYLTDIDRDIINRMVGVVIVENDDEVSEAPPSATELRRARETTERLSEETARLLAEILSEDDDDTAPVKSNKKPNVFGDDRSYLNYFADQNPISYFGFSNLATMVDFLKSLNGKDNGRGRYLGWATHDGEWHGTDSMAEAMQLARFGWPEGIELAEQIRDKLTRSNPTRRRRKYSEAGGAVNVGKMLAGNPKHMINRPKQPGKKVITFFVEAFISAVIDIENSIIRAAVIAAIADVLEHSGYSCEIVSACTTKNREGTRGAFQVVTTLKAAGETLNLNDIVFALGHPAYCRRFCFGTTAADTDLSSVWSYMGSPTQAFNKIHPTKPNEIYVKQLMWNRQRQISKDKPLVDRAMQLWDLIVSDDLPITLNRED